MKHFSATAAIWASILSLASSVTISQINGINFLSPYAGQTLSGIEGLVTAKGSSGFYLRSTTPDLDDRTSESIYVFGSSSAKNVDVGDIITLTATVSEYRSSVDYIYLTELASATNIVKLSTGNPVQPIVLGSAASNTPPTQYFSSLDTVDAYGYDVLAVPNNVSRISISNPVLQPAQFGLDFWESLSGELVTLRSPRALGRPNSYRETWVVGNYPSTGGNERGGLTMTGGDSNPETIIVGTPLDGTKNPTTTKLGDNLADITGVVQQQYGYYYLLPLTNITILSSQTPATPPATTLISSGSCEKITFGDYNVDNLLPTSSAVTSIANHIANYLRTPDIMFLQEITDNSGAADNGVVSSTTTLENLASRIYAASGVQYNYTVIDPVNDQDGGAPGYNIRVAYLFNPLVVRLRKGNPGGSTDANQVLPGPELLYNPGRIDPSNDAWTVTRKPLAAAWETIDGKNKFFTVDVHWSSKGGGTTVESDARPPVNGVVDRRIQQAQVTGDFVAQILRYDPAAKIVVAGDFNEFTFVKPIETFLSVSGLQDLDEVTLIPKTERYTYLYEMNSQELDHLFVSNAIALAAPEFEHIHLNTWATASGAVSDHDPSVARLNVCAPPTVNTTSSSTMSSTTSSVSSSSTGVANTTTTSSISSTTRPANSTTSSAVISSTTRTTNSTSSSSSMSSTSVIISTTSSSLVSSSTAAVNSTSSSVTGSASSASTTTLSASSTSLTSTRSSTSSISSSSASSRSSTSFLSSSSSVLYPNTTMTTSSRSSTSSGSTSSILTLSSTSSVGSSSSSAFDSSSTSATGASSRSSTSSFYDPGTSTRTSTSSYYDPGTSTRSSTSAAGSSGASSSSTRSGGSATSSVASTSGASSSGAPGSGSSSSLTSNKASSSAASSAVSMVTSVVYTTRTATITACPSTVPDCPAKSTYVVTSTIALYTTICPATAIPVSTSKFSSLLPTSRASSIPGVPMTTSVVYTTKIQTVTACPATVVYCPAQSTYVLTSTIALYTTVCPVTPVPVVIKTSTIVAVTPKGTTTIIPAVSSVKPASSGAATQNSSGWTTTSTIKPATSSGALSASSNKGSTTAIPPSPVVVSSTKSSSTTIPGTPATTNSASRTTTGGSAATFTGASNRNNVGLRQMGTLLGVAMGVFALL